MMATWADLNATQKAEALQIDDTAETTMVVLSAGDPATVVFSPMLEQRRAQLYASGAVGIDTLDVSDDLSTAADIDDTEMDSLLDELKADAQYGDGCSRAEMCRRVVQATARQTGKYP
jgi:hypothetical protein